MTTKTNFLFRLTALALATFAAVGVHAGTLDTFDPTSNMLTLQSVTTGGQTFYNANVKIGSYSQLSVGGGAPVADSFDQASNMLTMGAVSVGGQTYNNVRVHIDSYSIASVGAPFSPDTMRAQAMQRIQEVRQQCGNPQGFNEVPQLDAAASAHMNYMTANGYFAIAELAGKPGYTAASINQQIAATGYKYISLPEFSPVPLGATGGQWVDSVLSTTLGAARLLQAQETGLSFAPYPTTNPTTMLGYGFFGNMSTKQFTMQTAWSTYPCNGMTGVAPLNSTGNAMVNYADEAYAVGALSAATTGTPITFVSSYIETIKIKSVTLTDSSGAPVPVQWFDGVNGGLNTGYAVILPNQPLKDYTTYTVNALVGKSSSSVTLLDQVVNFSFTTGASVVYPQP